MSRPFELTVVFRTAGLLQVAEMLAEMHTFSHALATVSPKLSEWLLKGNTKQEAFLYEVFNAAGPTPAATAVLNQVLKNETDPRIVSMWNGLEGAEGASLQFVGRPNPETCTVILRAKPSAFTPNWKAVSGLVRDAASLWHPASVNVETAGYFDRKTFKDRPGVGWMLYLPKILSASQVPEARALVPVMNADKKQAGTIVVSITDDAFSDENPEHVKIANAIEIRLVDQDLLPRYSEL